LPADADAVDKFPELAAGKRIHTGGGLIQDQQIRVMDECTAQSQFLLHTAGKLARGAVCEGSQAGTGQQLLDAPLPLFTRLAEQAAEEIDVLEHRQGHVEVAPQPLGHVGDARAHDATVAAVAHVAAENGHGPLLDLAYARDKRQQAGLADSVGADQTHHTTARNLKIDMINSRGCAVTMAEIFKPRDEIGCLTHGKVLRLISSGHCASGSRRT